ncbi:MAG: hypothetical protein QF578_03310 [Alphaproteobacteria bacterium]|jgi:hypothetical protein|nr:hypothetical protein [Alphaproteobacteria bacterium]MDP6563830.1 hypothetical protein [Alphaproteobacteria bacterium]MDP6811733.1 hypothetical protein [Alphaproteobacteria bacterium]
MSRWLRFVLVLTLAAPSAGCTAVAVTALKSVDNTVSKLVEQDCQILRVVNGNEICRDETITVVPSVYCYRTLGAVDCYDRADPKDRLIEQDTTPLVADIE